MGHAIQEKLPVQYPAGTVFRMEAMIIANTKSQSIWFNINTKNSIFWVNKYFVGYDLEFCLNMVSSNLISKKANLFIKEMNIFRSYHKHFWHTVLIFFYKHQCYNKAHYMDGILNLFTSITMNIVLSGSSSYSTVNILWKLLGTLTLSEI